MKHILIIEDEPIQQQAYKLKLSGKYSLSIVSNEKQMLGSLQKQIPDLIILDIMLPGGKNGFDILTELHADPKTKDIPVIVLTNLDESERHTALDLGAKEYITKTSVNVEEIEKVVEKYVSMPKEQE